MADATFPAQRSWLDRPIAPSWLRLAVFAAHWEIIAYAGLVVAGLLLRTWGLGDRAMHHDESLHAYYAWRLFVGQGYSYDPLMHGPFQFEVVPLFYLLFGAGEFAARLLPALLGTALIFLPFYLRHHLGRAGALLTATMLAVSPVMVYYSRFIRDDIYLACFSLGLFICIVRYLETHQARYVYIGAVCLALAIASMEAAYITVFIFGSFLAFEAAREFLSKKDGPVILAFKATTLDTWLTGISILVVLTVLMYSTFFTNPSGVWDSNHGLLSANRTDILGGLTYWKAQHSVARGGQPWFYYLLVLPLYEQLAVVFGLAGLVYAFIRRSLVTTFIVWWAVMSLAVYSWAGEKMPWLSLHIDLPFIVLGGMFLGAVVGWKHRGALATVAALFAALLALEVHSTFALSFQDGANPTELLIYVQTAPDVPNVAQEIRQISQRTSGDTNLQIGLDTTDLGGWPFIWYLRDYPHITETTAFSGPACGGKWCPVELVLGPEFDANSTVLMKHYVVQKYRWNWWFPEDYKTWFPQHVGSIPLALGGHGSIDSAPVGTSTDWQHLWNWVVYRQPFAERSARWLYFLVRRDLVPNSRYYSTLPPSGATTTAATQPSSLTVASIPATLRSTGGGPGLLSGPRGVAASLGGNIYVADTLNHRVVEFNARGTMLRTWGSVGTGQSQFNHQDSPQGIAVGPDGNVYVTDTWNERIQVFTSTGRFLRQWGGGAIGSGQNQFYGPRSIAVSSAGKVYVADTGNKRIQIFDRIGTYLGTIGSAGTGQGQFQEPSSVAVGPNGTVFVADFWNQRIQVFSPNRQYLRDWAVSSWVPQSYDEPYIAVARGMLFASDPAQHRVLAYSLTGSLLGGIAGNLTLPIGVAVEAQRRFAVVDATTDRLSVYQVRPGHIRTVPIKRIKTSRPPKP